MVKETIGRNFAKSTGLRYVHDDKPGFGRQGTSLKNFTYAGMHGNPIVHTPTL